MRMASGISGARARAGLAAAMVLAVLAATPALAGEPNATPAPAPQAFQPTAYELARLRAGQSWDSGKLSITELRPGTVEQGNFEKYIAEVGSPAVQSNLELLAALGPQIVTDDGDVLTLQTASATWGEPGIIPRSHLGADGVWEFARGCMRTYLVLKNKARQFCEDREIQALLAEIRQPSGDAATGPYSRDRAEQLKARAFDRHALAARRLPYERLDQLVVDLLLGVR